MVDTVTSVGWKERRFQQTPGESGVYSQNHIAAIACDYCDKCHVSLSGAEPTCSGVEIIVGCP